MDNMEELCSFAKPPLDEVVLGVQFSSPQAFRSTHLGDVHKLFVDEYPTVEDQPRLPPQFETFGGGSSPQFQLDFGPAPLRNRVWFISEDESHLLQFQDDRMLLNWRKRPLDNPYPRFEHIAEKFTSALTAVNQFFQENFQQKLAINQVEVSYINIIPIDDFSRVGDWVRFFDVSLLKVEGANSMFSEITMDGDRVAGRLTTEFHTVFNSIDESKAARMAFTFRGAPFGDSIDSARDLLVFGRTRILKAFCENTTSFAQERWGREN